MSLSGRAFVPAAHRDGAISVPAGYHLPPCCFNSLSSGAKAR